jgi:hypothetical protein
VPWAARAGSAPVARRSPQANRRPVSRGCRTAERPGSRLAFVWREQTGPDVRETAPGRPDPRDLVAHGDFDAAGDQAARQTRSGSGARHETRPHGVRRRGNAHAVHSPGAGRVPDHHVRSSGAHRTGAQRPPRARKPPVRRPRSLPGGAADRRHPAERAPGTGSVHMTCNPADSPEVGRHRAAGSRRAAAGSRPGGRPSRWAQAGPDGRVHRIVYQPWRSPGGVAVEAEEDGEPFDGGAKSGHHSQTAIPSRALWIPDRTSMVYPWSGGHDVRSDSGVQHTRSARPDWRQSSPPAVLGRD